MNREKKIIIRLNQGEEHRVRLGCVYESDSFFYDSYRRGADILKEILAVSCEIRKQSGSYKDECIGTEDDNTYEFPNNIIAFCGERGEGKTSAMRTFAHALENLHNTKKNCSTQDVEAFWGWRIEKYNFFVLPVIDPTMMREQDSFMRIILSRMFAQLRCYLEQENLIGKNQTVSYTQRNKFSSDQLEKIITGFRECYAYLDTLSKKPDIDNRNDDLEEIANLGDSGSLRGKFRQLVRDYLKLMSSDRGVDEEDVYLVMQIDDADLNMRQAYNILEDIRNFCLVPEVVILMAMDIKQLYQIIEQHYVCDFELLLKYGDSPFLLNECRGMAVKYIDKVIPGSRQIYLPKINEVIKDEYADFSIQYFAIRDEEKEDVFDKSITDYQERLLVWLNKKTGMVFVKPFTYRHNFLPGYLRELAHFLVYFDKMADLNPQYKLAQIYSLLRGSDAEMPDDWKKKREEANGTREKWLQNLRSLEQYFLRNWGELHLSREGEKSLLELSEAADTMKPIIIDSICDNLEKKLQSSHSAPNMLEKDSYGYLMKRLDLLSHEVRQEKDYCLVYALRFYYSLHVYKRLLALAGDDNSYRHLPEDYRFVTWIPDYFREVNGFSYGRFEVNLYALSKLCQEFSGATDKKELLERVSKIFYIVSDSGKARTIRKRDIDALLKDPTASSKQSIHIIFDLSYFLFSIVCRRDGLYTLPFKRVKEDGIDFEVAMVFANVVFQLLFNWDIQHYIEKMADTINLIRPGLPDGIPIDLEAWIIKYWHDIVSIIADSPYLTQVPDFMRINEGNIQKYDIIIKRMVPFGFGSILYGNEEYARHVLVNYKKRIDKTWGDFVKAGSDVSSKVVALDGFINLLLNESKTLKCYLLKVDTTVHDRISKQREALLVRMASGDLEGCEILMREDSQLVKDCEKLMKNFENNINENNLDIIFGKLTQTPKRRKTVTI